MKTRFSKILAICVTLVILASLFAFAAPVAADDLAWSGISIPGGATGAVGNVLVATATDVTDVAISPNFATDKSVFAAGANNVVYRSTNGGYTWSAMTTLAFAVPIVELRVSPNYANDKTVFVATTTTVYRSTDGGVNFSQLGIVVLAGTEVITSMDVTANYDGIGVIAVGVADPAAAAYATQANSVQAWGVSGALNWGSIAPALSSAGTDVVAVKYSPNYPVDSTLLVVTADAGTNAGGDSATADPYLRARVGTVWDTAIARTQVNGAGVNAILDFASPAAAGNIFLASIAIPSDYNASVATTRRVYVALADGTAVVAPTITNVYRITNVTAGAAITPLGPVGDIAYSGTFGAGTLVGGFYDNAGGTGANVYRTTNPADAPASVLWYGATNAPTGEMAATTKVSVALDANFATSKIAVAGTTGNDSAFAISKDGAVSIWNETGLIDNGGGALTVIGDLKLSPKYATDKTIFIVTDAAGGSATNDTSVWKTTDGGATWARLVLANFTGAGLGILTLSPAFDTDSAVWVADATGTAIQYSSDKGDTWAARTAPFNVIGMAATDANTIYVAESAGARVSKSINNAWTWSSKTVTGAGNMASIAAKGSILVVGDVGGGVFRSDDANTTWAQVGTFIAAATSMFVDVDGDYMYAADLATGSTFRFQKGVSTAWTQLDGAINPAPAGVVVPAVNPAIKIAADKTLYVLDADNVTVNTNVYRSINPNATTVVFEWMAGLTAAQATVMDVVTGASNIVVTVQGITVRTFTDNLSAGSPAPKLIGPADKVVLNIPSTATFQVDNASNADVTNWQVQWSTDSNFINNVTSVNQIPPATQIIDNTLTADAIVYWRARAAVGGPLVGPWSVVRQLNPQLTVLLNFPAQVQPTGATAVNTPIQPIFNWAAFKNATGYQFQLAKDAAFKARIIDLSGADALGVVTSYYPETPLDYSTAYYWRVQAITAGGAKTDWSPGVGFVTMAKPAPPVTSAPPVITFPPQPTPIYTITVPPATQAPVSEVTPGYIYAIIAIGAILVIAVIVLIVRTRRTV